MVDKFILTPSGDSRYTVNPQPQDEVSDAYMEVFDQVNTSGSSYHIIHGYPRCDQVWHAYGGFQSQSVALSLSGWTHVTNVGNNLWNGLEADGLTLSADVMTVVNAGDYVGSLTLVFQGSVSKDYHIRVYNITQAAQMGYIVGCSGLGVGNIIGLTLPLYLECDAGDQLRVEMMEAADTAATVTDAVFYIAYLHE